MKADTAPIVSIIIPCYNHAHFLREALQSVQMQSFSDWEVVVINNYSKDETIAVVTSFEDSRIRLENFHNNGVIAASRNRGIALARGRYIAFLDSDDAWHTEKLSRCIPYLDNGADLVSHGLRLIGESEGNMYCGPYQRATYDELLDKGNCITPSATMVRKDLVESVGCFSEDPAIVTSEDYHLWLKLAKTGAYMKFINEILGNYRVHAGSQQRAVLRHLNSVLAVVNEFMPGDASTGMMLSLRYRRRAGLSYYGAGRAMQRNGQFVEAWKFFLLSIVYRPFFLKTYAAILLNIAKQISSLTRRLKIGPS